MNREDIIGIATKSWLTEYGRTLLLRGFDIEINIEELERFATLVADAAKLEMLMAGHDEWLEEARKAEREACAKVCEEQEDDGGEWDIQQQCANAIRARGNT